MRKQVIIVDDEPLGIERIRLFLEEENDFEIIEECRYGLSAVEAVRRRRPDLLFLDIQMPDLDGFGVIEKLCELGISLPGVIFVTAYDEYAVRAFEVNAVDYLLKPVQEDRFKQALDRFHHRPDQPTTTGWDAKLDQLLATIQPASEASRRYLKKIEIRSVKRTDYIDVDAVYWLEADSNYVELHTQEASHLARMTLAELERQIDPGQFIRVSRSSIVNCQQVRAIEPVGRRGHELVLKNGCRISITRSLGAVQERIKYAG